MAAGRCDALMAPLAARLAAPGARPSTRPAASSTCGPSTTAARIGRLEKLGVTGVITNDPRLFGQLARARRWRPSSPPGRRPRWSGARPRWRPRRCVAARRRVRQRKRTTPRSVTGLDGLREAEAPAGLGRRRPCAVPTRAPAGVGVLDVRPRVLVDLVLHAEAHREPHALRRAGHRRADADRVRLLGRVADVDRRPRRRVLRARAAAGASRQASSGERAARSASRAKESSADL